MKKFFVFCGLVAALVFASTTACKKSNDSTTPTQISGLPDSVSIKMFETVFLPDLALEIKLDSVAESRCPDAFDCIWAGMATARFQIKGGGLPSSPHSLSISANQPMDSVLIGQLKLKMIELKPYPTDGTPIPQADYVAKLLIEKI